MSKMRTSQVHKVKDGSKTDKQAGIHNEYILANKHASISNNNDRYATFQLQQLSLKSEENITKVTRTVLS